MAKLDSSRGIRLSREALLYARKVKCVMTQEQLANKVGTNVREIQRAEAEENIDPAFADAIAQALDEKLDDLVKKDDPAPAEPTASDETMESPQTSIMITQRADGRVLLQVVVDRTFTVPDLKQALILLHTFETMFTFENGFVERQVTAVSGSLIIRVPLSRRDAGKLLNAFLAGELESFHVCSIQVLEYDSSNPYDDQSSAVSPYGMLLGGLISLHGPSEAPSWERDAYGPLLSAVSDIMLVDRFSDSTVIAGLRAILEMHNIARPKSTSTP